MNERLLQTIEEKEAKKNPELPKVERTTMTIQETADYLGLSSEMIYKLCRQKQIPHIRIGSRIFTKLKSIDVWLEDLECLPE